MTNYYLLWIGESVDTLHAPNCEMATCLKSAMLEYCKSFIQKVYTEHQYVVMAVKTIPSLPFADDKPLFTQTTCSVSEFIRIHTQGE